MENHFLREGNHFQRTNIIFSMKYTIALYFTSVKHIVGHTFIKSSSRELRCHTMQREGTAAQTVTLKVDSSTEEPSPPFPPTFNPELSNSGESKNSPGNI